MQSVKTGNHEKAGAKLRRSHGVPPGTHPFCDELAPFKCLHADESHTQGSGRQHQGRGFRAITAIGEIDGHGHGAAATDQHKGHDGDQNKRDFPSCDRQGKHFTRVRPGRSDGHAY
ncbi:hypothetical protein D3C73_1284650 [compost metagenome]